MHKTERLVSVNGHRTVRSKDLVIGTVHAMQGLERDYIILSFVLVDTFSVCNAIRYIKSISDLFIFMICASPRKTWMVDFYFQMIPE